MYARPTAASAKQTHTILKLYTHDNVNFETHELCLTHVSHLIGKPPTSSCIHVQL